MSIAFDSAANRVACWIELRSAEDDVNVPVGARSEWIKCARSVAGVGVPGKPVIWTYRNPIDANVTLYTSPSRSPLQV
jgi:hypothetical protein